MRLLPPVLIAAVLLPALAGCGGMNRAVGVFPNALDDLADVRERGAAGGSGGARDPAPRAP